MKSESQIQTEIIKAAYVHPMVRALWRNNVGAFKKDGRWIRYGVGGKGASDLMGIVDSGIFLACEVKKVGGVLTQEQKAFLQSVHDKGGIAIVAHSAEEFNDKLTRSVNRYRESRENPF